MTVNTVNVKNSTTNSVTLYRDTSTNYIETLLILKPAQLTVYALNVQPGNLLISKPAQLPL